MRTVFLQSDAFTDGGADAVLVGETLMRAADKKRALAELKGEL